MNVDPAWIEATGTWALFFAAAIAARQGFKSLSYAAATQRMHEQAARREQARQVSAWARGWRAVRNAAGDPIYEPFEVIVYNGSGQPVYDVEVRLMNPDWRQDFNPTVSSVIPVLTPESPSEPVPMPGCPAPAFGTWEAPPISIVFRDNEGTDWDRLPDGTLRVREPWKQRYPPNRWRT